MQSHAFAHGVQAVSTAIRTNMFGRVFVIVVWLFAILFVWLILSCSICPSICGRICPHICRYFCPSICGRICPHICPHIFRSGTFGTPTVGYMGPGTFETMGPQLSDVFFICAVVSSHKLPDLLY